MLVLMKMSASWEARLKWLQNPLKEADPNLAHLHESRSMILANKEKADFLRFNIETI